MKAGNSDLATRATLEALVEASSDALFSQDRQQRITTWNRSAQRLFGYVDAEAIGQPASVLFAEHRRTQLQDVFDTVAAGDHVHDLHIEVRRRDGMSLPVALTVLPVRDAEGRVVGSVAAARDITEQRVSQAVLAETEALLREGEALAHVGRWLWDAGADAVQWSDEFHRIHGVDPLDFGGTLEAHLRYVHSRDRERVHRGLREARSSGRPVEDEYRIVRPDGELRWIYSRAEPTVGSDGKVVGLRGVGHDVTERRVSRD